jgi:glycosyltransferase involved in cell wall biosynthesis
MKILFFTGSYGHASKILGSEPVGEHWVNSLLNELNKIPTLSIAVACYYGNVKLEKIHSDGIDYYFIPNRNGKIKRYLDRFQHIDQRKEDLHFYDLIIQDFNPGIIHIFGTEKGFGLVTGITGVPVIIHLQGIVNSICSVISDLPVKPLSLIRYDSIKQLLSGKGLFHGTMTLKKKAIRELEIFRLNHYYIGRTNYDLRLVNLFSPGNKYFHVDEVIRTEFSLNKWSQRMSSRCIIHSTILGATYKGFENIILTSILLKNAGIEYEWRIAGIKRNTAITKLWSRKLNININNLPIIFLGNMKTADLVQKMLEAHLYVHPSHIENSSNAVCEAMLLGMPVIATYAGGTPGILKEGEEGILVQSIDPNQIAGAIIEMINDFEKSKEFGTQARITATKRHNSDSIIKQLLESYKEILGGENAD